MRVRTRQRALSLISTDAGVLEAADRPPLATDRARAGAAELILALVREALVQGPTGAVRIASVGCAPAIEIATALERWPEVGPRLAMVMVAPGGGPGSAAFNHGLLAQAAWTGARIDLVSVDPQRALRDRAIRALGRFDLIYSADWLAGLPMAEARSWIGAFREALASDGVMAFGATAADVRRMRSLLPPRLSLAAEVMQARSGDGQLLCLRRAPLKHPVAPAPAP
jgi:hypothetical protein